MSTASDDASPVQATASRSFTVGIPLIVTVLALPAVAVASAIFSLWIIHQWNTPLWLVCILGTVCLIFGSYLIWRYLRLLAQRRFQISVRTMLVWFAVFSVLFGLFWNRLNQMWRQQSALAHLAANGGYLDPDGIERDDTNWLRKRYRFDPFAEISWLDVTGNRTIPVLLEHSKEFADLEGFAIYRLGDVGVQEIGRCNILPKFEGISCYKVAFTDAGLEEIAKCDNLKDLYINGASNITDQGLKHLIRLKKLTSLSLTSESAAPLQFTDAGLKAIAEMSQLQELWLGNMPITDAGVRELEKLSQLQELQIDSNAVTPEAIRELGKKLPECWIQKSNSETFSEQIQEIVIWQVPQGKTPIKTITDREQISKIFAWYHEESENSNKPWDGLRKRQPDAHICIEFKGCSRCFFRVAFGKGALWFEYHERWNRRDLTEAEEQELSELLDLEKVAI